MTHATPDSFTNKYCYRNSHFRWLGLQRNVQLVNNSQETITRCAHRSCCVFYTTHTQNTKHQPKRPQIEISVETQVNQSRANKRTSRSWQPSASDG